MMNSRSANPLPIKRFLYSEESLGCGVQYEDQPGEAIDHDRLANGDLRCWISTNHSVKRKKEQQYIFQNPLCFSPYEKLNNKIDILKAYLGNNPNTKIHVPLTDGRLVTVKSPLEFLNAINNMKMLSENELGEIIAKHNLSKKQVRIIDYSLSKQRPELLLQPNYKFPLVDQKTIPFRLRQVQIDLSDFAYLDSKTCNHIVKNLPSEIMLDVGWKPGIFLHQVEYMKEILKTNRVTRLNIKEKKDENGKPCLFKILIHYHSAQLGNLRALTVEESDPGQSRVSQILPLCTNLVFLELKSTKAISEAIDIPIYEGSLNFTKSIKELQLSHIRLPNFFYNLPEMDTLILNCSEDVDWKKLKASSPKLQNVTLSDHLQSNAIACLQLPKLQSFKCVSVIKQRNDTGRLSDKIYPLLTDLDVAGNLSFKDDESFIPDILQRTPNLKKLTIRNLFYNLSSSDHEHKFHLPELNYLNISSASSCSKTFRYAVIQIIKNTQNLTSLIINDEARDVDRESTHAYIEYSAQWVNDNLDKFSKLTSFSLTGNFQYSIPLDIAVIISAKNQLTQLVYLDSSDFSKLPSSLSSNGGDRYVSEMRLQCSPLSRGQNSVLTHVKKLTIAGCKQNQGIPKKIEFFGAIAVYNTLEELKFLDVSINNDDLAALLARNSRIKQIELSGCIFQKDENIWNKTVLALPRLREINLSGVKLSSNMLLQIIFSAPRLKKMSIKGLCEISHPVAFPLSGEHTLKEVEIENSDFHSTAISAILNQGNHINQLAISSLRLIDNEIPKLNVLPKLATYKLYRIRDNKLLDALLIMGESVRHLDLTTTYLPNDTHKVFECRFPKLSELNIFDEVLDMLNEILASTRSLKNLNLMSNGGCQEITIAENTLHAWAGLQVLVVGRHSLPRYVLQYCPNLTALYISGLFEEYHKDVPLMFPYLKSLEFSCIYDVNDLRNILNNAPNIKMMRLGFGERGAVSRSADPLLKYVTTHREISVLQTPVISADVARVIKKLVPHAALSICGTEDDSERNNLPRQIIQQAAVAGKDKKPSEPIVSSDYQKSNSLILQSDVKQHNETHHVQQYVLPNKQGYPKVQEQIIDTYDTISLQGSEIVLGKTPVKNSEKIPIFPEYKKDLLSYHLTRCKTDANYEATHFYLQAKLPFSADVEIPAATVTDDMQWYETVPPISASFTKHPKPIIGRFYLECDTLYDAGDEKTSSPPAEIVLSYIVRCKDKNYIYSSLTKKIPLSIYVKKVFSEIKFIEEKGTIVLKPSAFLEKEPPEDILQALIGTMQNIWKPNNEVVLTSSGAELCNKLLELKTGRCVQQAILVKIVADHLKVPCVLDANAAHITLRLFIPSLGEYAIRMNTGGYQATVKSIPMQLNAPAPTSKKLKPSPAPAKIPDVAAGTKKSAVTAQADVAAEIKKSAVTIQAEPLLREIKNSVPGKILFDDFYFNLKSFLANAPSLKRSALLHCRNSLSLLSLAGELLTKTRENNLDSFYIDDLEKLGARAVSSQFGIVESGLKQFLERQKKQVEQTGSPATGWLVIHVSSSALGLFNLYSALDVTRILGDAGEIPPGVSLICLMQENNFSQDISYTSRFALNPPELVDAKVELPDDFVLKKMSPFQEIKSADAVNLYGGDQGKSDTLDFLLKVLNKYLKAKPDANADDKISLNLQNVSRGNLNNFYKDNRPLYISLLQLLSHYKEFIDGRERYFPLDASISLTQTEEDFSRACSYEALTENNALKDVFILNPATYTHFLNCFYSEKQSGHIKFTSKGILANHANKDLTVRLTSALAHPGQWSRFFDCVRQHNVKLRIIADPRVCIPTVSIANIANVTHTIHALENKDTLVLPTFSVVFSRNPAASADIIAEQLGALPVYISRTHTFADLFESFRPIPGNRDEITRYEHLTGDLIRCLREKKPIVLFGHFSLKLAQRIESLVAGYLRINGEDEFLPGQVVIITKPHHPYPAALARFTHSPEFVIKETKSDQPVLPSSPVLAVNIPADKKTDIPQDELAERLDSLSCMLREKKCPFVYIQGKTAVGKSVTIRDYLKPHYEARYKDQTVAVFEGGSRGLIRCLEYHRAHPETLCLWLSDEANLEAKGKFDFLHGFTQKYRPGIMQNLLFYPKSDNLTVIFTGNPQSYAGRQSHAFFRCYPEMFIYFEAYSRSYVEHYVIRPLLTKLLPNSLEHQNAILQIFHESSSRAGDNTSMIRCWPQMCFRLRMFWSTSVFPNIEAAAKMAAYEEVEGWLTPAEQTALQSVLFGSPLDYQKQSKILDDAAAQEIKEKLAKLPEAKREKFFLEPSHYHSIRQLNDHMKLRKIREEYPEYLAQGTRGVVLQGDMETGKTSMLNAVMDIHEVINAAHAPPTTKSTSLYHLVTSTNAANDSNVLRQGGILICNELDFMPEGRFYDVLTGVSQEDKPSKDQHQFAFFATQNGSARYNNRIVQSPAAKSRICKIIVPAYSEQEHVHILLSRGFPNEAVQKAIDKKNKMGGTWRSVYREVETHAQLQKTKESGQDISLNLFKPQTVKSRQAAGMEEKNAASISVMINVKKEKS